MRGRWSEHGPHVLLLTPDVSFTLPFLLLPVPEDSEKLSEGGFVPCRLQVRWSPAPPAAPLDCLGVLPPLGALWATAGLVADSVAAAELQKGPAGGARESPPETALPPWVRGAGRERTLAPASWAEGRGWTKRAGSGGHRGLPVRIRAGTRAWDWAGEAGDLGSLGVAMATQGRP